MAINWTTVQDAITVTMDAKLEDRAQAVTEAIQTGITDYYNQMQEYTDAATAQASLEAFLTGISTWINTNGLPTNVETGEQMPAASRTLIQTQIETEVEDGAGDYVDTGVSGEKPTPEVV